MLNMRSWGVGIAERVSGLKGSPRHERCQGEVCVHVFNRSVQY